MKKRAFWWFLVIFVTGIAVWLRMYAVNQLPIDYDEDDYLGAAIHYAGAMRAGDIQEIISYDFNFEHPPLAKMVYGAALLLLPQAPVIAEKPPSAPIALSLPEPHFHTDRAVAAYLGSLEALVLAIVNPLAGLFLAVNTWQIKYTSQIMLEPLPSLTSLLAVVFYIKSGRRLNLWLVLSAMMMGLTAASKYPYGVVGIAILAHWLSEARTNGAYGERPYSQQASQGLIWILIAASVFFAANPRMWVDPANRLWNTVVFHGEYAQSDRVRSVGYPFWQPLVWIFRSVPWHQGVFLISVDSLIALLAMVGLPRLWRKYRVYALWFSCAVIFLLFWPTKWPQYVLMFTAPLSLSAGEGFQALLDPLWRRWLNRDSRAISIPRYYARQKISDLYKISLWLLPGAAILALIALYPMLYQAAMALTDFNATSIKDGLNGGVWREAWLGITGQVEPVAVEFFRRVSGRSVHYAGPSIFLQLVGGRMAELVVFGLLWTLLAVSFQTALGVGTALALNRTGVLFKRWWRVIYILPWAIPEFVSALIWAQVFDPRFGWFTQGITWYERADYPGAVNFLTNWQSNSDYALLVLLITATWYGFPFMLVAATAGLKMISMEVYEAAAIDGASGWGLFTHITWPLLMPLLVPAFIIRAIFSFNQFYLFYVLRPPFPLATFSITSFTYFDRVGQYGVSAAINIFTVLILLVMVWWFSRWNKAAEGVRYA